MKSTIASVLSTVLFIASIAISICPADAQDLPEEYVASSQQAALSEAFTSPTLTPHATGTYDSAELADRLSSQMPKSNVSSDEAVQHDIEGQVTDAATGEPLPGVNVIVQGTTTGAITDVDGQYELTAPSDDVVLEFSIVGFITQEVPVDGRTVVNVALEESVGELEELVVTATGEIRAREVGSSMARVRSSDFEAADVANPQDILAGRVSGATVLQNSGQPGSGGTIRLRGNNSITQGNRPIIYVDGVRIQSGSNPTHFSSGQSSSPLNNINPGDIENIDIVKGAAATTLYGTEASGGVIRISTKRGIEGVSQFNARVTSGINNAGHVGPREGNPAGLFINECAGENLVTFDGQRFEDATCPESGSWLRNGMVQRYHLSGSGGIDRFNYYVSGNYSNEQGVIDGGGGHRSGGFRGNFRFEPVENLTLGFTSSYTQNLTDWISAGNNADGFVLNVSRGPGGNFSGAEGCSNPDIPCVANGEILRLTTTTQNQQFISSFTAEHNFADIVNNRFTVGYDYNTTENNETYPFGYMRVPQGEQWIVNGMQSVFSLEYVGTLDTEVTSSIENTLNWGGQLFRDESVTTTMFSEEFSGPQDPTLVSGARKDITSDNRQRVINAGMFGQAIFAWNDQLFVTAGFRVDGNSAFGDDFGLQFYPQVNTSYVISDNDFWPEWWDTLRLRAAIGESGKAPGTFDAVRNWSPIAGDDGQPGFTPGQLGNPDLGPERSREIEAGFTSSMFAGRVGIDATVYNQNTYDALIPLPSIPSQGFLSSQLTNIGQLNNRGFEFDVDLDVLRLSNLSWSLRFGYSNFQSEVVDLGGVPSITTAFFGRTFIREGYPVPAIFGARITNPDEIANPEYEEDAYIGPAYPETNLSFGTTIRIGDHVTVRALGESSLGGYMVNGTGYQNSRRGIWSPCYDAQQQDISSLTAQTRGRCALNATSDIVAPRYDNWIESTDFFRLRNISVSFSIPPAWYGELVDTMTLDLAASNLFTITDFRGTDPEVDDYRWSLARRDYYADPTYRTFTGTLRFSF